MSACGKMYCMPLNHKRVLEIDPCAVSTAAPPPPRGSGGGARARDAPPAEARRNTRG